MKIIIPMAGRGSRLRPHTLTVPKPLIPISGKPIVQRIVEDLATGYGKPIEEIAFIIGDFGEAVEQQLLQIAQQMGAKGSIYYQDQPMGPAHAIACADKSLEGPCMVAFADTLFNADFNFDTAADGIIWVQKVTDPSSFGVVKTDEKGIIHEFVEKSPVFVSDLAIVGLYYIKQGEQLRDQIHYNIENDIKDKGEFQITTALEMLKDKGVRFEAANIEEWLDCGNKDNVLSTNKRILALKHNEKLIADSAVLENAIVIPPCYIGDNSLIRNSVIGPYVSVGNNSTIDSAVIVNSIIQDDSRVESANLQQSMIGNRVEYTGKSVEVSLGDYSKQV
ncbi:MAG: sugar phosphate nucleotidyltransferase [Bacteroidota bacterium]